MFEDKVCARLLVKNNIYVNCHRRVTTEFMGKFYCRFHDPVYLKGRLDGFNATLAKKAATKAKIKETRKENLVKLMGDILLDLWKTPGVSIPAEITKRMGQALIKAKRIQRMPRHIMPVVDALIKREVYSDALAGIAIQIIANETLNKQQPAAAEEQE